MTEKTELLPCPFCGDTEGVEFFEGKLGAHVGCSNIYCMFQPSANFENREEAIKYWNRRTK